MPRSGAAAFVPLMMLTIVTTVPVSAQKGGSGGTGHAPSAPSAPSPSPRPTSSGTSTGYPATSPYPYGYPYGYGNEVDPEKAALYDRLHRQERQKQVVKDTDRLLKLTADYQQEIKTSGQTPMTEKRLREIEKLAHDLRATLVQ